MKRAVIQILFFSCIIYFLLLFSCASADTLAAGESKQTVTSIQVEKNTAIREFNIDRTLFTLPDSLEIIGGEAFEGTAIKNAILPDSIKSIGDYAFASIEKLQRINIPEGVISVGMNIFFESNRVEIFGTVSDSVRDWAKKNAIPCTSDQSTYLLYSVFLMRASSSEKLKLQRIALGNKTTEDNETEQTGRLTDELSAFRYERYAAFQIQGRAPPFNRNIS